MKATELRIGNWIKTVTNREVQVAAPTLFDFHDYDFHPIPLTEEWLVKLGFRMHEGNQYRKYYLIDEDDFQKAFEVSLNPPGTIDYCFTPRLQYGNRIDLRIDFVHQLQNLYFALTGQELTIKETVK